jgi:CRP-like cAMP-binding protein
MASKAEKLIAKGRSHEAKGHLEKALGCFRDATKADPVDPEGWLARGEAAARLRAEREAAESFFKVGDMYARAGMPREALKLIVRVLELDPQHEGARRFRKMLERRSGEIEAQPEPAAEEARPVEAPAPPPAPPASEAGPTIEMEADEPEPEAVPVPVPAIAVDPHARAPVQAAETSGEPSSPLVQALAAAAIGRADGAVAEEFSIGRITAELALEDLSLGERLPSIANGSQTEIHLDDEPKLEVVQAVAGAIGSSPLLSELDSDLVKSLIDAGTLVRRLAGQTVFSQGDLGTSLYLILGGEVGVMRESPGEAARELARLRAGAFFGEMALITNQPRTATVKAASDATLLEVSRKAVRGLIEREPRVLKLLMRFFRARLVGTLLQTSPVFEPFSREDRRKLVGAFRLRELGPGHAVFEEGTRAEGLFVLLAGRLEVARGDRAGQVLALLSPGDVFGEMSLLDDAPAMATVRATVRSWVLLLPRAAFGELAERYPQLCGQLRALADTRRARNQAQAARERRVEPL